MGKAAVALPATVAAGGGNPIEQFVQKVMRVIDEKKSEVDRAAQDIFNKKPKNNDKSKDEGGGWQKKREQTTKPKKKAVVAAVQQQKGQQNKSMKKAADEREVKEYIAKSYNGPTQPKPKPAPTPAAAPAPAAAAAPAKMSKKAPQKVTAADLSDEDKAAVGAAMNPVTVAAGAAAVIVACYAASKAMRKPPSPPASSASALAATPQLDGKRQGWSTHPTIKKKSPGASIHTCTINYAP